MNIGSINIEGLKAEYSQMTNEIMKETKIARQKIEAQLEKRVNKIAREAVLLNIEEETKKISAEIMIAIRGNVVTMEPKYYQHPVISEWYVAENGQAFTKGETHMIPVEIKHITVRNCTYIAYNVPNKCNYREKYGNRIFAHQIAAAAFGTRGALKSKGFKHAPFCQDRFFHKDEFQTYN